MIEVYFHLEFSGIGVYCYTQNSGLGCRMKVQLDNSSINTWSVSGEQISRIFCVQKRAPIRTSFLVDLLQVSLAEKNRRRKKSERDL